MVAAWRQHGIDAIVLKGATTAQWLYQNESRPYVDADLLVDPSRLFDAADLLGELGFVPADQYVSPHAHPWIRAADRAVIDLHARIWGPTLAAELVWQELQGWLEPARIGGLEVHVLTRPARGLHLALHAAQHRDGPSRQADLRRALDRMSIEDWRAAERLADQIQALPMMGAGLALEPKGRELLTHLSLARAGALVEGQNAPLAIGFARLSTARGVRAKASLILRAFATERNRVLRLRWLIAGLPRTVAALAREHRHPPGR